MEGSLKMSVRKVAKEYAARFDSKENKEYLAQYEEAIKSPDTIFKRDHLLYFVEKRGKIQGYKLTYPVYKPVASCLRDARATGDHFNEIVYRMYIKMFDRDQVMIQMPSVAVTDVLRATKLRGRKGVVVKSEDESEGESDDSKGESDIPLLKSKSTSKRLPKASINDSYVERLPFTFKNKEQCKESRKRYSMTLDQIRDILKQHKATGNIPQYYKMNKETLCDALDREKLV